MDRSGGRKKMMVLYGLSIFVVSECWLGDYFTDKGGEYSPYAMEAVARLEKCLPGVELERILTFEREVRKKLVSGESCEIKEKARKCARRAYQDSVAEYVAQLVEDGERLCSVEDRRTVDLLIVAGVLGLASIFVTCFYIAYRMKKSIYVFLEV